MALLDSEKIIQDLNRRFAEPLPEFYQRRIIFWYDNDKDFEDEIEEISLDNAKLIELTGTNAFAVKKLLTFDNKTDNFLIYCTEVPQEQSDWLLPVKLYSEEFRADLISMWLEEMSLENNASIREAVKAYRNFFRTKAHRSKVSALKTQITRPVHLYKAVMAVLCGVDDTDPNLLIRTVLRAGLDEEANAIYQSFIKYGARDIFWAMVAQVSGYSPAEPKLAELTCHFLLTASTRTMRKECLAGLENYISTSHQSYCYDFISEWMRSEYTDDLYSAARYVEDELHLNNRFSQLSIQDLVDTEIFPDINEQILKKLMTDICNNIIKTDLIEEVVGKRRTMLWYERTQQYFNGILEVAHMQTFFLTHSAGFHTVEPQKIWKAYTTDYYQMDQYYRQFHLALSESLSASNPELDDLLKQVADKLEGLYSHWYLDGLGDCWTNACEDQLAEHGRVFEVKQQTDFYSNYVENANARIFVIISDAMRYEVAVSLAEELERETQAKVKIESQEAIFPTVTKFGMAALLPHKQLTAEQKAGGGIGVLADGVSTDASYRDDILKATNPKSIALKYKDFVKLKSTDRRALVKGMDVIYIYHDKIDEVSHTDEAMVFDACQDTIAELKNMVRIIINELSGTRILITSDHGFLYTYHPLTEDNKLDRTTASDEDVEVDRRYMITKKGAKPEYMLPVKFMDSEHFDAFAPRANVRIKKKGGGLNFVHGGISLQEMVVPVIDYHYLRSDTLEYKRNKQKYDTKPVELELLSPSHKISNMIFSLNFYQKQPVGSNREVATYQLYFTDAENMQISDTQTVIADKTSENNQDRTYRVNFNLKSQKYDSKQTYYLVIADVSGLSLPLRIEFTIDIAFAVDDFDFFS